MARKKLFALLCAICFLFTHASAFAASGGSIWIPDPLYPSAEQGDADYKKYGFYPDLIVDEHWESGPAYGVYIPTGTKGQPYSLPLSRFSDTPAINRPINVKGVTRFQSIMRKDNPFLYDEKDVTYLNMRATQKATMYTYATTKSKSVGSIPKYAQCQIVHYITANGAVDPHAPVWNLVQYEGKYGWVQSRYLVAEETYTGTIKNASTYICSQPSSNKKYRLQKLEEYAFVQGKYAENGFYYVEISGTWSAKENVKEIDPSWRKATFNGTVYYEVEPALKGYVPVGCVEHEVF